MLAHTTPLSHVSHNAFNTTEIPQSKRQCQTSRHRGKGREVAEVGKAKNVTTYVLFCFARRWHVWG